MEVKYMKEKGLNELTQEVLEKVEQIRNGFKMGSRVGLTALGRSTQWREELEKLLAMEVTDRDQTAAILLSPDAFKAILIYIEKIDQEREQMQLEALFEARKNMEDWDSGENLAAKALEIINEKEEEIRGIMNDSK